MRKYLIALSLAGLLPSLPAQGFAAIPENPIAIGNCTAKVKVEAARLRTGPSLEAKILGVRMQDSPLFVTKIFGKWAQVTTESGEPAYMAAYLLTFPADEILEQFKRASPPPKVGKKVRVKWATVNYRLYPTSNSAYLGHFVQGEELALLDDLGNGWSLVESRDAHGPGSTYGFVANRALAPSPIPDDIAWIRPLALPHDAPPKVQEPEAESLGQYCSRTAWTPELFALEMQSQANLERGQYANHIESPTDNLIANR